MTIHHRQSAVRTGMHYLPTMSLEDYLRILGLDHPFLAAIVDFTRDGADEALAELASTTTEFDSDDTGRGDSYRRAQADASVRLTGIRQLLDLAVPQGAGPDSVVLDVLGGDGTVARALRTIRDPRRRNRIVTGDISGDMVASALKFGLPSIRQSADFLFLDDNTADAAILAYGTHHIPIAARPAAIAEALRVVRPGGRVVVHDFDKSSPVARFFELVHHNTVAGHDYEHFSPAVMGELFADLTAVVEVRALYDPLLVRAGTAAAARDRLCSYVADMYGLGSLFDEMADTAEVWRLLHSLFDHSGFAPAATLDRDIPMAPVIYRDNGDHVAELPRIAIVAVARKPDLTRRW